MRIVVFTADPDLEGRPWWPLVSGAPGVTAVLVCRRVRSRDASSALRSLRRNVRKHGLIFIPYRAAVLLRDTVTGLRRGRSRTSTPQPEAPVETVEVSDMHAPAVLDRVRAWGPDLGLSLGAPILRRELFGIPERGTLNLHLGRVPDYRGAPPAFWELYTGASDIGATVHWIDDGLDTGRIVASDRAPIYPGDTLARVEARAAELGRAVLACALAQVVCGPVAGVAQPAGGRTFRAPTLTQRARLWLLLALRRVRPRARSPRFLAKTAAAIVALGVVRPVRDALRTLRKRHPVRIFTFHRVTDLCRDGMTVPPATFRRQIEDIRRHHDVVPLERALELLRRKARLRRPVAVISFDDGYRSVREAAYPAMAELGLPGCCFVSTALVGTEHRSAHDAGHPVSGHFGVMDWEQLAALRAAGWSVGAHTHTHARLSACDDARLRDELVRPLALLRSRLGVDAVALAYPFGQPSDITPRAIELAREIGYTACLSDFGGENLPESAGFELRRIEIGGDHDLLAWKTRVHGIDLGGRRSRGDGS